MSDYRPPQRVVQARVLTSSGWIRGSFHLPRMHSFLEFLGQAAPFFNLTGVALAGSNEEVPFLALRRSAARLILPSAEERRLLLAADPPNAVLRDVTCLLEAGAVSGRIALPPQLRVSDYLAHHAGFIQLRDAELGEERAVAPVVFLNAAALVAVSDGPRPLRTEAPAVAEERRPLAATA